MDENLHAIKATLTELASVTQIHLNALLDQYNAILKSHQSLHFTQDQPARAYRHFRFNALLDFFNINNKAIIEDVLDAYDRHFIMNITAKEGVIELFQYAKDHNTITAVITEGPYDAQLKTLKQLNIDHLVDHVFTSSREGVSKTDGLFEKALKLLKVSAENVVYIGDNHERDYLPARALSMRSYLLDELNSHQNCPDSVSSLAEFHRILLERVTQGSEV